MAPIRRVLIANRGEIAVRIIKACHELGKAAVAVYSEADRNALHVQHADETYPIGPAPAEASYLNIAAIIDAARRAGADAVHPGYGFLSENPAFAEACREVGLTFIGPTPEAMRAMGDKAAAKELARKSGVPVIPGYHPHPSPLPEGGGTRGVSNAGFQRAAGRIGYPLLVKAAAGGGGRGMRVVEEARGLREALDSARREAEAAFGDGRLLLERYLSPARHIEVQVMGDSHGTVVALGERECSLQRRHQKVVEEAPAPNLDPATRAAMLEAAARLAGAIRYTNAGTCEFILGPDGSFSFLEMNTRLQVEHGVTELVTGLDLVRLQIRIAEGERVPDVPQPRGHAIECRVYAEDPYQGFRPSPGRLLLFEPPEGPGIRNDVGVYAGDEVSPYYDPQLAKLLVYGADREQAIQRLEEALSRYVVAGVTANLPLLRAIATDPAFHEGRVSTRYLEEELAPRLTAPETPEEVLIAAAGFEVSQARVLPFGSAQGKLSAQDERVPHAGSSPWHGAQLRGAPRRFQYEAGTVTATPAGDGWRVDAGSGPRLVQWRTAGRDRLMMDLEGQMSAFRGVVQAGRVTVVWRGETYVLARPQRARFAAGAGGIGGERGLTAPMPALVARVLVAEGDRVSARQTLVVLQAMKMEHLVQAPAAGVVKRVRYREGDSVPEGAVLVELEGE